MIHRHLAYDGSAPVESLGPAAIDDLLERGDLADWAPLAAAITLDPRGQLAETVLRICDANPQYGTSPLWRAFVDRSRARAEGPALLRRSDLASLRRSQGLSQAALAARLGMSQSDLSKLERRHDMRLSTLRSYITALGASLILVVRAGAGPCEVLVGDADAEARTSDRPADLTGPP